MIRKAGGRSLLRQRRRDAASATLLDAAEAVIDRKGYDSTTMQDIAREAGCAAGTLYLYFRTKGELFDAMVAKHVGATMRLLTAAMEDSRDPIEKLRLSTEAHLKYMHAHPGIFRIFYTAGPGSRATIQASLRGKALAIYRGYRQLEIGIVAAAQKSGAIRADIPAEELIEFTHGLSLSACARWVTSPRAPAKREQVRLLWEATKGILGVPAARDSRPRERPVLAGTSLG
jgi:AcrR family transcriptional regulator